MKIQIMINGRRQPSLEIVALREACRQGQIAPNALAWDDDTARWLPACELPALHSAPVAASPPPASNTRLWFYRAPGLETQGPLTREDLLQLMTAGLLPAKTLIFRQGAANWTLLSEAPGLLSEETPHAPSAEKEAHDKSVTAFNGGKSSGRQLLRNTITLLALAVGMLALLLLVYTPANAHKDAEGAWVPDAGYEWNSKSVLFKSAVWRPGLVHPLSSHVHAASEEGHWIKEPGYEVVKEDGRVAVVWMPGDRLEEFPHVFAAPQPGSWLPDPGYVIVNAAVDLTARWQPNQRHPDYSNLISSDEPDRWVDQNPSKSGPTEAAIEDAVGRIIGAAVVHVLSHAQDDDSLGVTMFRVWAREGRDELVKGAIHDLFPQLSESDVTTVKTEISLALDGQLDEENLEEETEKQHIIGELQQRNGDEATAVQVADFVWRVYQARSQ